MSTSRLLLIPVLLVTSVIPVHVAYGQGPSGGGATCALVSDPGGPAQATALLAFPTQGTINALVVFVQNRTDTGRDDCFDSTQPILDFQQFPVSACQNHQDTPTLQSTTADLTTEWPQGRSTGPDRLLPTWASGLLAAPGTPRSDFPTGSLSQYYDINSGGRFALTGYVYPEVYLPEQNPQWYRDNRGSFENGAVKLSHEILSHVNANRHGIPLYNAAIFDRYQNGTSNMVSDGKFDMVIMIFRNNVVQNFGYPQNGNAMTSLGTYFDSLNGFSSSPIFFSGPSSSGLEVVDNLSSGSGVWAVGSSIFTAHTTIAHEIGHRQYGLGHSDTNRLGIMSPNGQHPAMFTAPDRLILGWVTAENVAYGSLAAAATPRTLSETFGSGSVLQIQDLTTPDMIGDVIIEARTHTNVWDQPAGPTNPFADGDIFDFYFQREGLLVYKRLGGFEHTSFASTVENTGFPVRGYPYPGLRGVIRMEYGAGDAYSPLTRMRFNFAQNAAIDAGLAVTDIARSGSGFSFSLWRDFLTVPGVKNLGTNYMFGNHPPISILSPGLLGTPYGMDGNVARTDDVTLGGTVRLTDGLRQVLAGSPTITLLPDAVLEVPAGVEAVLVGSPPSSLSFDTYAVTAGGGARIDVIGRLVADQASFEASDADGWGGLRFRPVSAKRETQLPLPSRLTGVSISGVRYEPLDRSPYPPHAAVEVLNRAFVIDGGTTISGSVYANGLLATGARANVTVSGQNTSIETNEGLGVLATAGANVIVTDRTAVSLNELGGVRAVGYGTRATVTGYATVDGNLGLGLLAEAQAHATVRSPAGTGTTSVSGNVGGPTGRSGGSVDGGQCVETGATGRANSFLLNNNNGANLWDASARGGSAVVGRYAFWGTDRTAAVLQLDFDGSSTIDVNPAAAGLGTSDPACPMVTAERAAVGTRFGQTVRDERVVDPGAQSPDVAGRGGTPSAAVVALATSAREAAWAGDTDGAFAALAAAAGAAVTDDDREAVFEATAALLADAQPPAMVAALEADAAGTGPDAPWAARALAVAYAESGQTASAETVAESLTAVTTVTTEDGHAAFGHALLVRLAVEADSAAYALDRLTDFAAAVAETDTLAVEAFESALALVAASFPDADLSAMTGSGLGRGIAGRGTTGGAPVAPSPVARAVVDGLSVWPNPASSRATARLSVSTPARLAVVSVYDALGRRVAVLHDGPLTVGPHDLAFDPARFAPGIYVVLARVTAEDGRVWTEARRVTVTR